MQVAQLRGQAAERRRMPSAEAAGRRGALHNSMHNSMPNSMYNSMHSSMHSSMQSRMHNSTSEPSTTRVIEGRRGRGLERPRSRRKEELSAREPDWWNSLAPGIFTEGCTR